MGISTLLKLNGVDYTAKVLTPFIIEKNKLWGEDTGRTMSGELFGTLIGIFPKIVAEFYVEDEIELSALLVILDSAFQTVDYYDPKVRMLVTLGTYTNDYKKEIISLDPFYSSVKVSFISRRKE